MTAQPTDQAPVEPAPRQLQPRGNSRLAQLHASYAAAKAAVDEAEKQLKAITDAIKLEVTSADPNARRFELLPAKGVEAPALNLSYVESWRVDSRKLKREDPQTYVRYAVKSGSWRLSSARTGSEG